MPTTKMTATDRRAAALKIALKLARKCGAGNVSVAAVAVEMKVTGPLLFHIFGNREKFLRAIKSEAKKQGVVLPMDMPLLTTLKLDTKKKAAKKVAALLKPKAEKRVRSIKEVKAIKDKLKAAPVKPIPTPPKKARGVDGVALNKGFKLPAPARKELTPAQRTAKAAKDKARRAKTAQAVPSTPAAKFASLPKPFEAAVQQLPNA